MLIAPASFGAIVQFPGKLIAARQEHKGRDSRSVADECRHDCQPHRSRNRGSFGGARWPCGFCGETRSRTFLRGIWAAMLNQDGSGPARNYQVFAGLFSDAWAKSMTEAAEGLEATAAEMGKTEKATAKLAKKQEKRRQRRRRLVRRQRRSCTKESGQGGESDGKIGQSPSMHFIDSWTGATLQNKELSEGVQEAHARTEGITTASWTRCSANMSRCGKYSARSTTS